MINGAKKTEKSTHKGRQEVHWVWTLGSSVLVMAIRENELDTKDRGEEGGMWKEKKKG